MTPRTENELLFLGPFCLSTSRVLIKNTPKADPKYENLTRLWTDKRLSYLSMPRHKLTDVIKPWAEGLLVPLAEGKSRARSLERVNVKGK